MVYLLDSNVFIEAKNRYYGLDFCPGFWDWMMSRNHDGVLFSVEKVAEEILKGKDELSDWMDENAKDLFLSPDNALNPALAQVSHRANGQEYRQSAVSQFFQSADYYLVAHALAHSCAVVTLEISGTGSKKRIKIPDVCKGLGVSCINPFEMLRKEGAVFVCP